MPSNGCVFHAADEDGFTLTVPRFGLRARAMPRTGLAGLAQARGRNAVPWGERLEWDARYAEAPARLSADLAILGACVLCVLRGRGAAAPGHATMPALSAERGRAT